MEGMVVQQPEERRLSVELPGTHEVQEGPKGSRPPLQPIHREEDALGLLGEELPAQVSHPADDQNAERYSGCIFGFLAIEEAWSSVILSPKKVLLVDIVVEFRAFELQDDEGENRKHARVGDVTAACQQNCRAEERTV
ncbi:hypothetical protein PG995_010874 [Apiospora arundinis]